MPRSIAQVRAGQSIRTTPINDLVSAYNRNSTAFGDRAFNLSSAVGGVVYCLNKTGGDLDFGTCAAFRQTHGDIPAQFTQGAFGYLKTPARSERDEYNIAVCAEKILDGGGGYCCISGACWARVQTRDADTITRAGFDLDEGNAATPYVLKPQSDGPLVMLHYTTTAPVAGAGDYWAYVAFTPVGVEYVLVKPDVAVSRFDIVGLGAAVYDPGGSASELGAFQDRPVFSVTTPDEDLHRARFAVMQADCASGEYGRAIITGQAVVQIAVVNATDDSYAEIKDGETGYLEPVPWGSAKILWKEPGTGPRWAIVDLCQRGRSFLAELAEDAPSGGGEVAVTEIRDVDATGGITYSTREYDVRVWAADGS